MFAVDFPNTSVGLPGDVPFDDQILLSGSALQLYFDRAGVLTNFDEVFEFLGSTQDLRMEWN